MAVTPVRLAGTLVWLKVLVPQATTLPLPSNAKLWDVPAATLTTFDSPGGTLSWPEVSSPQATTKPGGEPARAVIEPNRQTSKTPGKFFRSEAFMRVEIDLPRAG